MPGQLNTNDGQSLPVVPITSIDLMARSAFRTTCPESCCVASIRSTAKAIAQYQMQQQAQKQNNGLLGLAALAVTIGSVVTESADERTWRTLPSEIAIARGRLPSGPHTITLQTPEGMRSVQLNLAGRYAVVGLRLLRGQLFLQAPEAAALQAASSRLTYQPAPAPSTGGGPETLEQQSPTMETSK